MPLHVRAEAIGKKLSRLLTFHDGTFIGEYERSQAADISRKKGEIAKAEQFLLSVYRKHGPFVVRWDGATRTKSVRINETPTYEVPKEHWEKPSWL